MGWTVYYKAVAPKLDKSDVEFLEKHVAKWTAKLDPGSESYRWEILDDARAADVFGAFDLKTNKTVPAKLKKGHRYLGGFTKIHFSSEPQEDFSTIVQAVKELADARPQWTFKLTDDYETLSSTDPRALDPDELL